MRLLSFSNRLFLTILLLFWLFVGCFVYYQYLREKSYKAELLNTQLSMLNNHIFDHLDGNDSCQLTLNSMSFLRQNPADLRVTLMHHDGRVFYDNSTTLLDSIENHSNRDEVKKALRHGKGYSIKRTSSITGVPYFYSATYFPDADIIVRTAKPYNVTLYNNLKADMDYIWLVVMITLVLSLIFYNMTSHLGATITRLRHLARRVEKGEDYMELSSSIGDDELDQIAGHIIDIYDNLNATKDDLILAQEKLIAHLQISNEGLAIFSPRRTVILSNSLFMQYMNLISDTNINQLEDVFTIKELEELTMFLNAERNVEEKYASSRKKHVQIVKNGFVFSITIVVFLDGSFELSIFDVTRQEEQTQMKRQITQNLAHELKTPVSSIQGYLETILNNPDMTTETRHRFIARSYAQSNRLTNLLRDITILTRVDEASQSIEVAPMNVSYIVQGIIDELELVIREKNMKVFVTLPQHVDIIGNESLVYSIFRNLMDNALAYAGEGHTIEINCFYEDNVEVYFSFRDNGVGVSAEHLSRLFERFYRVDKGRSRKIGGTGLGLAIVKNAVQFHGGAIYAKSVADGGLEFIFNLRRKA